MKNSEEELSERKDLTETESINVLVCISTSPSNQRVIRSASRFARGNQGQFTALYVDDGRIRGDRILLRKNIELARSLGATVEIVSQKDVLGAITQYALDMAVTPEEFRSGICRYISLCMRCLPRTCILFRMPLLRPSRHGWK